MIPGASKCLITAGDVEVTSEEFQVLVATFGTSESQITWRQDPAPEEIIMMNMNIMIIMSSLHLTLVTETVTSVGMTASTNTSPAMGHVMKVDTNAGASVFLNTTLVSVEQSHYPSTVSSTAA